MGFGFEPLGGALANALMILPEELRFIVVVDFSGSLFWINEIYKWGYVCAVGLVSGGGGAGFGAGFDAGTVGLLFDAAVPTTTAGGTYFVSCRFFFKVRCED